MIILIDFDGTCVPQLPAIGWAKEEIGSSKILKKLIKRGHKLVLWTARSSNPSNTFNYLHGKPRTPNSIDEALEWFRKHNIKLYGVNTYSESEKILGTGGKILGDLLIDDTALGIPLKTQVITFHNRVTGETEYIESTYVDWKKTEWLLKEKGIL